MHEESSPEATTLKVLQLVPYTLYRLRITAWNVVGASEPSDPTKDFQTIQAPPAHPPYNVTVRAMSSTELRVRWIVSIRKNLLIFNLKNNSILTAFCLSFSLCNKVNGLEMEKVII